MGGGTRLPSLPAMPDAAAEAVLTSVPCRIRTPSHCVARCLPHPRRYVVFEPSPFLHKGEWPKSRKADSCSVQCGTSAKRKFPLVVEMRRNRAQRLGGLEKESDWRRQRLE
jgi:hypothetical protein